MAILFGCVACAGNQDRAREPPAGDTDAPSTTPAQSEPAPPARSTQAPEPTTTTSSEAPAPPLRAGSGGGYTPEPQSAPKSECAPDSVRKKLEQVVRGCQKASERICGELKVRASEDAKSVRVTLDVTKQSFDDSFSRCVTSRMNAVEWHCSLPGSDVTLDLGCEL